MRSAQQVGGSDGPLAFIKTEATGRASLRGGLDVISFGKNKESR
jgi:hypothetical protein